MLRKAALEKLNLLVGGKGYAGHAGRAVLLFQQL
jgi:hypothetical protein